MNILISNDSMNVNTSVNSFKVSLYVFKNTTILETELESKDRVDNMKFSSSLYFAKIIKLL